MIRLKNVFRGKSALNIMGGPSLLQKNFDFSRIDTSKYTVFLESKALTPGFINYGIVPDFFIMFYPWKAQTNAFQHVVYQSFLVGIDLTNLLHPDFLPEYVEYKRNFDHYFALWKPERSVRKKYKIRTDASFKNSPLDLLPRFPMMPVIMQDLFVDQFRPLVGNARDIHTYKSVPAEGAFSLDRYYQPSEVGGGVALNNFGHVNSAAIALFPLQYYMGFEKIYFLGMDMSMLGSMEFNALHTFKSMKHYAKFFNKATQVFNAHFKKNKKPFLRPPEEFTCMKEVLHFDKIEYVNVYEPFEYASPLEGIRNISFEEFLHE